MNRPLQLYVYNNEYDVTRTVTMTPSRGWGGEGALGCVLGFGALHRVPPPLTEPMQAAGETMFESARFSNEENRPSSSTPSFQPSGTPVPPPSTDFLVPANIQFSNAPPVAVPKGDGPPKSSRKARAHHVVSPGTSMDEYFKEGEEKSREQDHSPAPRAAAGLPPPPKAGAGPPKAGPPKASASPAPPSESEEG